MERKQLPKRPTHLAGEAAIRSHAHKRMYRMTVMGLSVPKLIALANLKNPTLTFGGASLQAGRGSREHRTEAAHNLPRDLLLDAKPFWSYAEALNAHPRIKLQMFYSAAATMTVPRESNYLDSSWEKAGLPAEWLHYLERCVRASAGMTAGTLGEVKGHAHQFKQQCRQSLTQTTEMMEHRPAYQRNEEKLDEVIQIYEDAIDRFDPAYCLERTWHIYQSDKYR